MEYFNGTNVWSLEMSDIKVSVIVPVYNVEKYLRQCLDSIINQTLKEIEILCINDGSTDSSPEILKEYEEKDSRIKIINKKNAGLSAARNQGLELAKGEYVSFIDSDDWINETFCEALYTAAKKYDSDIACGGIVRVTGKRQRNKLIYKKEEFTKDTDKKNRLTKTPVFSYVWNKIYKRESLIKSGVTFPVGRVFEDVTWSIKAIYYLNGVVTTPSALYYYRKTPTSIMSAKSEKNAKDYAQSEKEMLEFAKENNLKLLDGYKYSKRDKYQFLGVTILKRFYYYPDIIEYCLFGFIPVYKGHIRVKSKQ